MSDLRKLPILVLALGLGAILTFLYLRTQENESGYFQNLALVRHLQQLDARWELDVIRSRVGLNANYDSLVEPLSELGQLQQRLDETARNELTGATPALLRANAAFGRNIQDKTRLIEAFKSHNSILQNSLAFLPTAATDLQKAVRGSPPTDPLAGQAREILLEVLVYNEAPAPAQAKQIEAGLQRLSRDSPSLQAPVRERLDIFVAHVRTILVERVRVNRLLHRIAAVPTGARIDAIEQALGAMHQTSERHAHQNRQILQVFSGLLVALLLYLAAKLVRSHAEVRRVNSQLGQVNMELERRVGERTAELQARNGELQDRKARLSLQTQELARARDVAEAANEAKSAFLATMSHELRTPLNAIIGFTELMLTQIFGPLGHPKYTEYVTDVNKSGAHLLALINDILDLSRLDAGKAELVEEPFSAADLVRDVCRSVTPLARQSNLELVTDIAPGLPDLKADQRRVRQIVLNLVSNAVKFTPAGGTVTVKVGTRTEGLMIQVSDTGIGIPKDQLSKALERFGQVDSSLARKYEGTGLGLPLVRQLVEIHDGRFQIESEPDVGTTVTITFPAWRMAGRPAVAVAT